MKRKHEKPAHRAELPLKRGVGRIEIKEARATERELRNLLECDPEHFRALRAIVEGHPDGVTETHRRDLKIWAYLLQDGSPRPAVAAVMRAGVRDTPDGIALAYPLDLTNPDDAATLTRAEDELEIRARKGWADLQRRIREGDKDQGPGWSP